MNRLNLWAASRYMVEFVRRFEEAEQTQREVQAVFSRTRDHLDALLAVLLTPTPDELASHRWESEGGAIRQETR